MKKPEPARLIDAEKDSPLRDALLEARGALGTQADVARVRVKLDSALPLAVPSASIVTTGVAQTAAWSRLALHALLIVAGGSAMFAGWSALQARSPEPQRAIVAPALEPAAPQLEPALAIEAPAAVAPEQAPTEQVAAPARAERGARKKPIAASAPAPAPGPPASSRSELSLLHEAQDKLALSPQSALLVLDQHAREYPSGNFALERESLAIGALRKLGRESAARTRARRFVNEFANAPQAPALRAWLERNDHKNAGAPLPTR